MNTGNADVSGDATLQRNKIIRGPLLGELAVFLVLLTLMLAVLADPHGGIAQRVIGESRSAQTEMNPEWQSGDSVEFPRHIQ